MWGWKLVGLGFGTDQLRPGGFEAVDWVPRSPDHREGSQVELGRPLRTLSSSPGRGGRRRAGEPRLGEARPLRMKAKPRYRQKEGHVSGTTRGGSWEGRHSLRRSESGLIAKDRIWSNQGSAQLWSRVNLMNARVILRNSKRMRA